MSFGHRELRPADLVLCVGHDLSSPGNEGAVSVGGVSECFFWRDWAPSILVACKVAGIEAQIVHRRESVTPWTMRQIAVAIDANATSPKLVVDLHFNAWDKKHTGACGFHHPSSTRGKQACDALVAAVAQAQGNKALSSYGRTESWGGSELCVLTRTWAPAVVWEPFFGDNESDWASGLSALESGATQKAFAAAVSELLEGWAR